jgi:vitamin B12 transporter
MKKIILLALCLNFFSSSLFAEDIDLNPIVVIGNLQEQRLNDVMTSVSVITRQDIDRLQPQDIGSILQTQPGIEIARNGGLGMQTSIFMRGTNSSQVLVLIDGMKVTDEFSNATPLQNIPISQVDHIEILRGNASALYGPRAMGGVIQIFTKSGQNISGAYGSLSYGSRNTQNLTGGYSGRLGNTILNVSLNHQETDGFASRNPSQNDTYSIANPTKNTYHSNSFSMNLSHEISKGQEVGFKILGSKFDIFSDAGFDYGSMRTPDGVNGMNKLFSNNISSQLFLKNQISEFWNSKVTYGVSNINNRNDYNYGSNQSNPVAIGNYQTYQKDFSWLNDFVITNNQTLLVGIQSNQIKTKDQDSYYWIDRFKASRVINSIFAGYSGKFNEIGIQLNVREDNINTGLSSTTGLFGMSYNLNRDWKIAGNISNSFSAPTLAQLYSSPAAGGNRNLKPEEDNSAELSLQYFDNTQNLRIVAFNKDIKNLIQLNPDTLILENISKAKNSGIEFSGQKNFNNFIFKASATFQDPLDKITNTQLLRRAKEFSSIEVNYTYNQFVIGEQTFISSSTTDIPLGVSCPSSLPCRNNAGYSVSNLYGSYKYDKNWILRLNLENIFNKTYQQAYGFNTPGFGAFLTIQYQP